MVEVQAEPRALRRVRSHALRLTMLDVGILAAAGIVVVLTLRVAKNASVSSLTGSPAVELIVFSALTIVALSISVLAWIRSREGRLVAALHESSAFLLAATLNAVLVLPVLHSQGSSMGRPVLAALLDTTLVNASVAAVLLVGASRALKRKRVSGSSVRLTMVGPVVVSLSTLMSVYALDTFLGGNGGTERFLLGLDRYRPAQVAMHLGIAVAFLVGAALYRRLFVAEGRVVSAFMSVALVVMAGSQVQIAIAPHLATSQLVGDAAMRVAFYALVLSGYAVQLRSDVRALRRTSKAMGRSRQRELLHAARAERFRAGREIHDGIAQDLAAARLPIKALRRAVRGNAGLEAIVERTEDAISEALVDTRRAIEMLRGGEADAVQGLPDGWEKLDTDERLTVAHLLKRPRGRGLSSKGAPLRDGANTRPGPLRDLP